ncbi:hypothetical protein DFH07DRAFT_525077 [Mycena maculata]|uniref:Uncharacterized protein n=1 Tax=Mycena maculata TaxID=230809 RepID=A0AAD7IW59_9AGAR|nr:hypothetical protein DFH07DRAFT_525077 [Mycena maculata]
MGGRSVRTAREFLLTPFDAASHPALCSRFTPPYSHHPPQRHCPIIQSAIFWHLLPVKSALTPGHRCPVPAHGRRSQYRFGATSTVHCTLSGPPSSQPFECGVDGGEQWFWRPRCVSGACGRSVARVSACANGTFVDMGGAHEWGIRFWPVSAGEQQIVRVGCPRVWAPPHPRIIGLYMQVFWNGTRVVPVADVGDGFRRDRWSNCDLIFAGVFCHGMWSESNVEFLSRGAFSAARTGLGNTFFSFDLRVQVENQSHGLD